MAWAWRFQQKGRSINFFLIIIITGSNTQPSPGVGYLGYGNLGLLGLGWLGKSPWFYGFGPVWFGLGAALDGIGLGHWLRRRPLIGACIPVGSLQGVCLSDHQASWRVVGYLHYHRQVDHLNSSTYLFLHLRHRYQHTPQASVHGPSRSHRTRVAASAPHSSADASIASAIPNNGLVTEKMLIFSFFFIPLL
jgi:hypothetical protein